MDFPTEPVGFSSGSLGTSNGRDAVPAPAGAASPDELDAINASPLAYFGNIVEQLGKSMSSEGKTASAGGADPSYGVNDAIDMLDSIVSMMSLYAAGDGAGSAPENVLPEASAQRALGKEN